MTLANTSDQQPRSNMLTREEWLHAILYSGKVTRIGQHLALVIYHLSDPATNTARLSARDLERITGWSKTAIVDHLAELEVFVRVTWGAGRAKSIFELQGVIAEAIKAAHAATTVATEVATNRYGQEVATRVATMDATTSCGNVPATTVAATAAKTVSGNDSGRQDATKPEKSVEGGTIGGESGITVEIPNNTHSPARGARGPDWLVSEDGGFEGKSFEISGPEVDGLKQVYAHLEWPAELVAADQFFAREFDRVGFWPPMASRMAGLHTYLAKQNRKASELRRSLEALAASKGIRKPAQPLVPTEQPSCWFDGDARLQVANGFKTELLTAVGGDEIKLRDELDKAAPFVGSSTRGPQLMVRVRARVVEAAKGRDTPQQTRQEQLAAMVDKAFEEKERNKGGYRS